MSPRASRALNVGHTCGGGVCVMPRSCPEVGRPGLDESELLGQPLRRRAPGQLAELAGEVRLVVDNRTRPPGVANVVGCASPAPPALRVPAQAPSELTSPTDPPPGAVEPDHPRRLLGRQAELGPEHVPRRRALRPVSAASPATPTPPPVCRSRRQA